MTFKEQAAVGAPPKMPPTASAATNDESCQEHFRAVRKPPASEHGQVVDSVDRQLGRLPYRKVRAILTLLEKGRAERAIAIREHVSESEVAAVRTAYFSTVERAIAIVRTEHLRTQEMIAEMLRDTWEDFAA